jgi:uncharacterized delta-60 repeat protein
MMMKGHKGAAMGRKFLLRLPCVSLMALLCLAMGAQAAFTPTIPAYGDAIWGLDATFGEGGVVAYRPSDDQYVLVVGSQTFLLLDGKILAQLEYYVTYGKFTFIYDQIARFSADGVLEASLPLEYGDNPKIIGVQSDGKFILRQYREEAPYLLRYWSDFSPDSSFGVNGEVALPPGTSLLTVQEDDKIVGVVKDGYLFRLNADGATDSTFPPEVGPFAEVSALVTDGAGNILVADVEMVPDRCSARVFSESGALLGVIYDTHGWEPDNYCDSRVFAPHPDGGFIRSWVGGKIYKANLDGTPDAGFGDGGKLSLTIPSGANLAYELYLISGAGGEIYFAGRLYETTDGYPMVGSSDRYGNLDLNFGHLGYTTLETPVENTGAIFYLPDGKLLLAGFLDDHYILMRMASYPVRARVFMPVILYTLN